MWLHPLHLEEGGDAPKPLFAKDLQDEAPPSRSSTPFVTWIARRAVSLERPTRCGLQVLSTPAGLEIVPERSSLSSSSCKSGGRWRPSASVDQVGGEECGVQSHYQDELASTQATTEDSIEDLTSRMNNPPTQEDGRTGTEESLEGQDCEHLMLSEISECPFFVISLFFAEVAHAIPEGDSLLSAPWAFIVVSDKTAGDDATRPFWLLFVHNSKHTVEIALSSIGARGAIRVNFTASFEMAPKALGTGGCATVYLAKSTVPELHKDGVAIKILTDAGQKADRVFRREVSLLAEAQGHPNVVQFFGVSQVESPGEVNGRLRWAAMLQCCTAGDLHDRVARYGAVSVSKALDLIHGIFAALAFVHDKGIVHRDLKGENILLGKKMKPLITDFGVAARIGEPEMAKRCGSPGYVAPEVLDGKAYDTKVDVFGAGVVMFFILSGHLPFRGPDVQTILRRNLRCKITFKVCSNLNDLPMNIKSFMLGLLHKVPESRLSSKQAMESIWFITKSRLPGEQGGGHQPPQASAPPSGATSRQSPKVSMDKQRLWKKMCAPGENPNGPSEPENKSGTPLHESEEADPPSSDSFNKFKVPPQTKRPAATSDVADKSRPPAVATEGSASAPSPIGQGKVMQGAAPLSLRNARRQSAEEGGGGGGAEASGMDGLRTARRQSAEEGGGREAPGMDGLRTARRQSAEEGGGREAPGMDGRAQPLNLYSKNSAEGLRRLRFFRPVAAALEEDSEAGGESSAMEEEMDRDSTDFEKNRGWSSWASKRSIASSNRDSWDSAYRRSWDRSRQFVSFGSVGSEVPSTWEEGDEASHTDGCPDTADVGVLIPDILLERNRPNSAAFEQRNQLTAGMPREEGDVPKSVPMLQRDLPTPRGAKEAAPILPPVLPPPLPDPFKGDPIHNRPCSSASYMSFASGEASSSHDVVPTKKGSKKTVASDGYDYDASPSDGDDSRKPRRKDLRASSGELSSDAGELFGSSPSKRSTDAPNAEIVPTRPTAEKPKDSSFKQKLWHLRKFSFRK